MGKEVSFDINNDNSVRRFDIPYLQRIKSIFTRKARALEKRRATSPGGGGDESLDQAALPAFLAAYMALSAHATSVAMSSPWSG